jgi:hypothetical protein
MDNFTSINYIIKSSKIARSYLKARTLCYLFFLFIFFIHLSGQDTIKKSSNIDIEIRPRIEYYRDYKQLVTDTFTNDFYNIQRNRLNFIYENKKVKFVAALQEIHLFGKEETTSRIGSINFYELYAEPTLFKNLSLRIGRQRLLFDNGRMFSDAPWAQQSRAHEGFRLLYHNADLTSDLVATFTRDYGDKYEAAYSPVASHAYQWLWLHHLKYKINDRITITTINVAERFDRKTTTDAFYNRFTHGGRFEFFKKNFYLTLNAFYQYGQTSTKKNINAFYLQPEISYTRDKLKIRLGAEIMSGDDLSQPNTDSHSFVPLYGVAWKFMVNMNFFIRFPADVGNSGLINPYLFVIFNLSKKITLRADSHLFYSMYPLLDKQKNQADTYLGFENDLVLFYKPNDQIDIQYGLSYLFSNESMQLLNRLENTKSTPLWSYLMVSYRFSVYENK